MEWTVPAAFLYRGNIISKESLGCPAAARQMKLPEMFTDKCTKFLDFKTNSCPKLSVLLWTCSLPRVGPNKIVLSIRLSACTYVTTGETLDEFSYFTLENFKKRYEACLFHSDSYNIIRYCGVASNAEYCNSRWAHSQNSVKMLAASFQKPLCVNSDFRPYTTPQCLASCLFFQSALFIFSWCRILWLLILQVKL